MSSAFNNISKLALGALTEQFVNKPLEEQAQKAQILDQANLKSASRKAVTDFNLSLKNIRQKMDAGDFDDELGNLNLEQVQQERELARTTFESAVPDYSNLENLNYKDETWATHLGSINKNLRESVHSSSIESELDWDIKFQEQRIIKEVNSDLLELKSSISEGADRKEIEAGWDAAMAIVDSQYIITSADGKPISSSINTGDEIATFAEFVFHSIVNEKAEPAHSYAQLGEFEPEELNISKSEYESYRTHFYNAAVTKFTKSIDSATGALSKIDPFQRLDRVIEESTFLSEKIEAGLNAHRWLRENAEVGAALRNFNKQRILIENPTENQLNKAHDRELRTRIAIADAAIANKELGVGGKNAFSTFVDAVINDPNDQVRLTKEGWFQISLRMEEILSEVDSTGKTPNGYSLSIGLARLGHHLRKQGAIISEDIQDPYFHYVDQAFGRRPEGEFGEGEYSPMSKQPQQIIHELDQLRRDRGLSISSGSGSGSSSRSGPGIGWDKREMGLARVIFPPEMNLGYSDKMISDRRNIHIGLSEALEDGRDGLGMAVIALSNESIYSEITRGGGANLYAKTQDTLHRRGYTAAQISGVNKFFARGTVQDSEWKMKSFKKALKEEDFNKSEFALRYGFIKDERGKVTLNPVRSRMNQVPAASWQTNAASSQLLTQIAANLNIATVEQLNEMTNEERLDLETSLDFEQLSNDSFKVLYYGNYEGNIDLSNNPLFTDSSVIANIDQDNWAYVRNHPLLSAIKPRENEAYFRHYFASAIDAASSVGDDVGYLPGLALDEVKSDAIDWAVSTSFVSEETALTIWETVFPSAKREEYDLKPMSSTFRSVLDVTMGPRAYGPPPEDSGFTIRSEEGVAGTTISSLINENTGEPLVIDWIDEKFNPSNEEHLDIIFTNPEVRNFLAQTPSGASFVLATDQLVGNEFLTGRALLDAQSRTVAAFTSAVLANHPGWADKHDGIISVGQVIQEIYKDQKRNGDDSDEIDMLSALGINDYQGVVPRSLSGILGSATTHFIQGAIYAEAFVEDISSGDLLTRLQGNPTPRLGPSKKRNEVFRQQANQWIKDRTSGLGYFMSANEVNDKIRKEALKSYNVLQVPWNGQETVRETLDRAIEVSQGVGNGIPVYSETPIDTNISLPEVLGPFLDGKIEGGMKVNIKNVDGTIGKGVITVVKDADTTEQLIQIEDTEGNTYYIESTGRIKNLDAAEVYDKNHRRGGGKRPYDEVGGVEATRFLVAMLNASGEATTIVISGEKGTFGRDLIDIKLGPEDEQGNQMDWAEISIKLGLGQLEHRFVTKLPGWATDDPVTHETVDAYRTQLLELVKFWQNENPENFPKMDIYDSSFDTNEGIVGKKGK